MTDSAKIKAISTYLFEVQSILQSGDAREHAYRPAFKKLIENLKPDIQVINEPAYTGGNAPDFLFKKGEVPIAYAECKDVTVDITNKDVKTQANRYIAAFGRILVTNYYNFEILSEEDTPIKVSIATKVDQTINPIEENFERFANLINDYITVEHRTIRSAKKLANIMANKARILRDTALASLTQNKDSDIYAQYNTFKEVLIRDLTENDFADMYAQTLVYGLFVARYYDPTIKTFSRHEAQDLLPASNPLLKKFFGHVAGTDYDPKIAWLVDSLVEAYLSTDVHELMHKEFESKQKDPVLHFYETFLAEYDKGLRKNRGVYYTPQPVVSFIVRSVDQILKSKFNLPKGLADTSKIDHIVKLAIDDGRTKDGMKRSTVQIHKVQVLDPAVGTGTFLNEVISEIYKTQTAKGQEGTWGQYVKTDLLPRIHGFELMMASYTMSHLKLGVALKERGYEGDDRLSVWLTNSLEESVHEEHNLFMGLGKSLTEESNEASRIKSKLPIMVVLGNPPYAVSSANKGDCIQNLIKVYKENLNERKLNLDDDYIKFIRFAENQIEKTGYGIVAMITNNSFIDGVTHRQMRKHLMETFDEIYIMDLHGNAKKKETTPNGGKDENVFSIMQGVSINIFVKTREGKGLAKVYHSEIFGKQKGKYEELDKSSFETVKWKRLKASAPYYFFVPKNFGEKSEYEKGVKIDEIFNLHNNGIEIGRENVGLSFSSKEMIKKTSDLIEMPENLFRHNYAANDSRDWKYQYAKNDIQQNKHKILKQLHRPFDYRYTAYTGITRGIQSYPSNKISPHLLKDNYCLIVPSQASKGFKHVFLSNTITSRAVLDTSALFGAGRLFPLYLHHEDGTKTPNLDKEIWQKIDETAGKTEPEDILDYIYAVLHSPNYREKYKEFLKIDFPRVPYPKDKKTFWKLVKLGSELRGLHLLESPKVNNFITTFPESGSNTVEQKFPKYEGKKVYINDSQYFGNVPEVAWNFYIGGYQPAQKWLKDRRGRELAVEDIEHYQMIIVALNETAQIMKNIDSIS